MQETKEGSVGEGERQVPGKEQRKVTHVNCCR
jgi:hypothetical protein